MGSFLIKQNFFFQKHKNKHWQSTVIATTDVGHLSIGCSNVCFTSLTSSDVEWELLCEPTMEPILTCAPLLFSFLLFLLLCFLLQLPTYRWGRVCLQTSWTFTSYQICGSYSTGWLVVSQWSSFSSSLKKNPRPYCSHGGSEEHLDNHFGRIYTWPTKPKSSLWKRTASTPRQDTVTGIGNICTIIWTRKIWNLKKCFHPLP